MLNSSIKIEAASRDADRLRSHFLVTILTLLASILIFVPVYLLLRKELSPEQDLTYLVLLMVSIIAFNLFFAILRTHGTWQILPYIVLAILFIIGYYLKFWQIAFIGETVAEEWQLDIGGYSTTVLLRVFEIITIGFATFCFTAIVYMLIRPRWPESQAHTMDPDLAEAWGELDRVLAILLPIVSIIVLFLLDRYNIGVRGMRSIRLPFRLAGMIFYFGVVALPALQLLFIHAARQSQKQNPLRFPLFLLIAYYFILTIILASRGIFLYGLLAAFFLLTTYPEYRRRSIVILLVAIIVTTLIFNLITDFRYLLVVAQGSTILALDSLFDYNTAQEGNALVTGTALVFSRIIGTNSLLHIVSRLTEPLGIEFVIREGFDLGDYYTHVLLGFSEQRTHRAAPSLFGWFYLVGELWAVWVGLLVFTFGTGIAWDIMHKLEDSGWLAIPVIQSLFLVNLIQISSDGGLHRGFEIIVAILGTMALTHLITWRMNQHRKKADVVQY